MTNPHLFPVGFAPAPTLKHDDEHEVLVVIPTVAQAKTLLPTVARILEHTDGRKIHLVIAINGPDQDEVSECKALLNDMLNDLSPDNVTSTIVDAGKPIGFGGANNFGFQAAHDSHGIPELTIFHNDDAHVSTGWLDEMLAALSPTSIVMNSDPPGKDGKRPTRTPENYGKVGIVGPVSNLVAGIQQVPLPEDIAQHQDLDARAALWRMRHRDQPVSSASFISGFCMGITREAAQAVAFVREAAPLVIEPAATGTSEELVEALSKLPPGRMEVLNAPSLIQIFDADQYPIAGYEDNDLCVRIGIAGFRCAVAVCAYVYHLGHQTFDRLFPEMQRGMRNRLAYYERWRDYTNPNAHKLVGVMRLKLEVPNDIQLLKATVLRAATVVDGMAILLTGHPLEIRDTQDWQVEKGLLNPIDDQMLRDTSGHQPDGVAAVVQAWLEAMVAQVQGGMCSEVKVAPWKGEFNERDERNASLELAESMAPTWLLSIDHDEVIEDRVGRRLFERCMRHPDPLVLAYDLAFINHWDSPRLVREDYPWSDGGTYHGGMHGFRLFRSLGRRIVSGTDNGLHCGNSPDEDIMAKRVASIRFRHLGYIRDQDRRRKYARYLDQDPNPDPSLVGGDYSHIIQEEGMRISPYIATNGVGLHMLIHEGEKVEDVARNIDQLYSVADRLVIVWTGKWADGDKHIMHVEDTDNETGETTKLSIPGPDAQLPMQLSPGLPRPTGDATGPSREMWALLCAYRVELLHKDLDDHIGAARNAALDLIGQARTIGWTLFVDPDEHFTQPYPSMVSIRRMAECSDAHGWLFTFQNPDAKGGAITHNYRMARNIPEIRFKTRIHETYDAAFREIAETTGRAPKTRKAPFQVYNPGLNLDDDGVARKFGFYQRLLLRELEDNPQNGGAWVSLGLMFMNDGLNDTGLECFHRALACEATQGYRSFQELAIYHLRQAKAYLGEALERVPPKHIFARHNRTLLDLLRKEIPDFPVVGSARRGIPVCPPVDKLPDFEITAEAAAELGLSGTLDPGVPTGFEITEADLRPASWDVTLPELVEAVGNLGDKMGPDVHDALAPVLAEVEAAVDAAEPRQ